MAKHQRVTIDGVPLHGGSRADALSHCLHLIRSGNGGRIATANLDFFALARQDPQLRSDLRDSSLVIIDGAPIAWLARLSGAPTAQRYAGVDLVADLCLSATAAHPIRAAILGSTPDIAGPATQSLTTHSPHVEFVFVEHPPFRPLSDVEMLGYKRRLSEARPDIVFVALGCPKQERLIAEWSGSLSSALWIGIGGALDFFAGKRRRAPQWAQKAGLEWVVRMGQDPRRLVRRYLLRDAPAMVAITPGVLRSRFTRVKQLSNQSPP